MWVFGYGSLVWKVDFPYEKRFPGFVRGYVRRFWQGSVDHRGTPGEPGRVVTLIPLSEWQSDHCAHDPHDEGEECWGVAYKIAEDKEEEVKAHLDHREKNGYEVVEADVFHPSVKDEDGKLRPVVRAMVYCATSQNESFLGPAAGIEAIGKQIAITKGPSGWNADYLLSLCHSMRMLAPHVPDGHLLALESAVLQHLDVINNSADSTSSSKESAERVLRKIPDFTSGDAELASVLKVDVAAIVLAEQQRLVRRENN